MSELFPTFMKLPIVKSWICSILIMTLFTGACKKIDCVRGIVLDKETGEPIPSVRLTFTHDYNGRDKYVTEDMDVYTGASSGTFYAASDASGEIHLRRVFHPNYSEQYLVEEGEQKKCEYLTIWLRPLDGRIELTVVNEQGLHGKVNPVLFSQCNEHYYAPSGRTIHPSPMEIPPGDSLTVVVPTCADDSAEVRLILKGGGTTQTIATTQSFWVGQDTAKVRIKY